MSECVEFRHSSRTPPTLVAFERVLNHHPGSIGRLLTQIPSPDCFQTRHQAVPGPVTLPRPSNCPEPVTQPFSDLSPIYTLERVFPSQDRLSRFWEVATSFLQLPHPPAHMWQRLLGHMSSLERFLLGGPHSHDTPPVSEEGSLITSVWQPSLPNPPVSELCTGNQVVAHRRQMDGRGSSSHSTPVPVVIYRHIPVKVGSSSSGPHSIGSIIRQRIPGVHRHLGDEGHGTVPGIIFPPG